MGSGVCNDSSQAMATAAICVSSSRKLFFARAVGADCSCTQSAQGLEILDLIDRAGDFAEFLGEDAQFAVVADDGGIAGEEDAAFAQQLFLAQTFDPDFFEDGFVEGESERPTAGVGSPRSPSPLPKEAILDADCDSSFEPSRGCAIRPD